MDIVSLLNQKIGVFCLDADCVGNCEEFEIDKMDFDYWSNNKRKMNHLPPRRKNGLTKKNIMRNKFGD